MPYQVNFPYGVWQSTDPDHRWRLVLTGGGCTWEERRGGTSMSRSVPLVQSGADWRAERPNNDAGLLRFLGAQAAVADEIVARQPPNSFLLLRLQGDQVSASWNGLGWSLTGTHLKECHIAPPKPYTLTNTLQGLWNGRMRIQGVQKFNISLGILNATHARFWVTDTGDSADCDAFTINGDSVNFSVGINQNQMNFSGQQSLAYSNLSGTFTSHYGNGQWEAGWVNIGGANDVLLMVHDGRLIAPASTFSVAALFR